MFGDPRTCTTQGLPSTIDRLPWKLLPLQNLFKAHTYLGPDGPCLGSGSVLQLHVEGPVRRLIWFSVAEEAMAAADAAAPAAGSTAETDEADAAEEGGKVSAPLPYVRRQAPSGPFHCALQDDTRKYGQIPIPQAVVCRPARRFSSAKQRCDYISTWSSNGVCTICSPDVLPFALKLNPAERLTEYDLAWCSWSCHKKMAPRIGSTA